MAYTITHRSGAMEADPPLTALETLLAELDGVDAEHPDVVVSHDSGWTLSAYPDGVVSYENVEDDSVPVRHTTLARTTVLHLFGALAVGDLLLVESHWRSHAGRIE